jgi:hypothetical protein
MPNLRFRQIHLDFHTSPHIPGIGEKFDKKNGRIRCKRPQWTRSRSSQSVITVGATIPPQLEKSIRI